MTMYLREANRESEKGKRGGKKKIVMPGPYDLIQMHHFDFITLNISYLIHVSSEKNVKNKIKL